MKKKKKAPQRCRPPPPVQAAQPLAIKAWDEQAPTYRSGRAQTEAEKAMMWCCQKRCRRRQMFVIQRAAVNTSSWSARQLRPTSPPAGAFIHGKG